MSTLHGAKRNARSRRGFSLLELMMAISVMTVGLLGFTQALITALRAQALAREQSVATDAARRQIEILRSGNFATVFSRFNASALDDPAGAASPGANFTVTGLNARSDDADGMPGEILFPVDVTQPETLREDIADARLGTPLDLDLDGVVDNADHGADFQILPVVVVVRWRSAAGGGQVQLETILGVE